jgi:hypothetical protein
MVDDLGWPKHSLWLKMGSRVGIFFGFVVAPVEIEGAGFDVCNVAAKISILTTLERNCPQFLTVCVDEHHSDRLQVGGPHAKRCGVIGIMRAGSGL